MKKKRFTTIRLVFWLSIGVAVALAGCGPLSITTTPPATPTAPYITPDSAPTLTPDSTMPSAVESIPSSRPLPVSIASIIRRDNDAGWRHYWSHSSQQVSVYSLAYDGQWLWIATEEGMIRLNPDSLEYELFPSTGTSSDVALDRVYRLAVDDQGQLWAAGQHGLVRYSKEVGWKAIYTNTSVSSFALDADGNLWFLSYTLRGVPHASRFQGQEPPATGDWKPEPVEWENTYLDPANWRLLVLSDEPTEGSVKDMDGNTWSWSRNGPFLAIYYNGQLLHQVSLSCSVAVIGTGMWIGAQEGFFYSDGHTLKPYRLAAGKATPDYPRVDSLAFTADGNGWAITSEGLFHFSENSGVWKPTTGTSMTMPLEEGVRALVASPQQNSLWAYTDNAVAHFDGQAWQRWAIPENVLYPRVRKTSVLEYQGALWFTNRDYALWRFDGQTWSTVAAPEVANLAQDHHGRLYAADRNDAILVYDGTNWQPLPDCGGCGRRYEFSEITVDATGNVWGIYESGIWRYSADEGWREILKLDTYTLVESPTTDAYGDFWFRSEAAVHCGLENCEFWRLRDEHWGGPITVLAADSRGRIWVGGYGLLSVYDPAAER